MSENEYQYKYYRQKYYDSCSEINGCEQRIYHLENERRQTVSRINQLRTDIRNTQTAAENLEVISKQEGDLNSRLSAVADRTDQAAVNFRKMAEASHIRSKNIADVYGDETAKTRNTLNSVWSTLTAKKNNLNTKLSSQQSDLKRADSQLQQIDSSIQGAKSDMSYWKQQKTNNYYNMEYYRKKMMQEEY